MKLLKISDIQIPAERVRKSFSEEAQAQLMESIRSKGLQHPITVGINLQDDLHELVAGENRLTCVKRLHEAGQTIRHDGAVVPPGYIPVVNVDSLSPDMRLELEIEENVLRQDLTWQEQAAARARLLALRKKQAAETQDIFTVSDLSVELAASGTPRSTVSLSTDLMLAKHLDNPEVAKAKTRADAEKIVRKQTLDIIQEALGEAVASTASTHKLIEGDCRDLILGIPDSSFSIILTDPPYGIDVDSAGSQVSNQHHYADGEEVLMSLLDTMPSELFRVATPQAHLYWFCDYKFFELISHNFQAAGWDVWPRPMIWVKNRGIAPKPAHGPRYVYECILFASKGNRPTMKLGPDVLQYGCEKDLVQAEKPKGLLVELLQRSAQAGDTVLDICAGSGSIFPAATQQKCRATGFEINPTRAALAKTRLE